MVTYGDLLGFQKVSLKKKCSQQNMDSMYPKQKEIFVPHETNYLVAKMVVSN